MSKLRGTSWPRRTTSGLSSSTTLSRFASSQLGHFSLRFPLYIFHHSGSGQPLLCDGLHTWRWLDVSAHQVWHLPRRTRPVSWILKHPTSLDVSARHFRFSSVWKVFVAWIWLPSAPGFTSPNWFVPSTASTRWDSSTGTSSLTTSW